MSEETLRRFLERLNDDAAFRESARNDPKNTLAEFGLSPAEQVALTSNDEDALRRLAGLDVSGFSFPGWSILCPPSVDCTHYPCPTDDCPSVGPCRK